MKIVVRQVIAYRRRRTESAELYAMSDHELRDIGLSRTDAHAIAAGTYAPDMAPHQSRTTTMTTASLDFIVPRIPIRVRVATATRAAGRALTDAARRLKTHREDRKAIRTLSALDERALKDIGLHRSGIGSAVRSVHDRSRR
ncbi:MAG TPA: DUF1127 domain-containing protein [Azospirillum sp.]|nr:DUF1127 domain-containing protein [Azospirillum sp.]